MSNTKSKTNPGRIDAVIEKIIGMSIHKQKQIISRALILIVSLSIVDCSSNPNNTIIEISDAINIEKDTPYTYSKESTLVIEGRSYSMRDKAIYKNGVIDQLIIYKPEGILTYQKAELLSDTALLNNVDLPIKQNWYNKGILLINSSC